MLRALFFKNHFGCVYKKVNRAFEQQRDLSEANTLPGYLGVAAETALAAMEEG